MRGGQGAASAAIREQVEKLVGVIGDLAESLLKRDIAILEKSLGPSAPRLGEALAAQAGALRMLERRDEAERGPAQTGEDADAQ